MGEAAEMMLDGTLCAGCGEYLDGLGDGLGIPTYCHGCQGDSIYEPEGWEASHETSEARNKSGEKRREKKERARRRKASKIRDKQVQMKHDLGSEGIFFKKFDDHHWRIPIGGTCIDVWPSRDKWRIGNHGPTKTGRFADILKAYKAIAADNPDLFTEK